MHTNLCSTAITCTIDILDYVNKIGNGQRTLNILYIHSWAIYMYDGVISAFVNVVMWGSKGFIEMLGLICVKCALVCIFDRNGWVCTIRIVTHRLCRLELYCCQVGLQGLQSSSLMIPVWSPDYLDSTTSLIRTKPVAVYKYNHMHPHMHSKFLMILTLQLTTGWSSLSPESACIKARPAAMAPISHEQSVLKLNGHG